MHRAWRYGKYEAGGGGSMGSMAFERELVAYVAALGAGWGPL